MSCGEFNIISILYHFYTFHCVFENLFERKKNDFARVKKHKISTKLKGKISFWSISFKMLIFFFFLLSFEFDINLVP